MTKPVKSFPTETQELLRVRVETSAHYLQNAEDLLLKREDRKAAELLWGAVAQMVKALMLVAGDDVRSHGAIRDFVRKQLAPGDPQLMHRFRELEGLHSHFYDARMGSDEVEYLAGRARSFVNDLQALLYSRMSPPLEDTIGGSVEH